MTNIFQSPNLLRINGDIAITALFGEVLCVKPNPHPRDDDRVTAIFRGLHLELTAQTARNLGAQLITAADGIRDTPDCSAITAHLEDQ